jgi:hypothetical protein
LFIVPRKDRGRGLMQVEGAYIAKLIKLEVYVEHEGPLIKLLGHTNATQIQNCIIKPPISRSLFRVTQSK